MKNSNRFSREGTQKKNPMRQRSSKHVWVVEFAAVFFSFPSIKLKHTELELVLAVVTVDRLTGPVPRGAAF